MSDTESQQDRGVPELWKYVSLDRYTHPKSPASEAVRKGLLGLWDKLRKDLSGKNAGERSSDNHYIDQSLLHNVPQKLLDGAAPEPNWNELTLALDKALAERVQNVSSDSKVQFVVFPTCSGTEGVLLHWAIKKDWQIITPPEPAEILEGGNDSLAPLGANDVKPFVIPQLERWYLRHHDGLTLIRNLIGLLSAKNPRCLIGINSWSLAYLNRILNLLNYFESPLTLQALDQQSLEKWFQSLANRTGQQIFVFRQTDNGNLILPLPSALDQSNADDNQQQQNVGDSTPSKTTKFLSYLAGYSRGIPMVAWTIWRHCLRSTQPTYKGDLNDRLAEIMRSRDGHTMWLPPWSQSDLPSMPNETNQIKIFVLHTILLHGQMQLELLANLLPFPTAEVLTALRELLSLRLIELENGMWRADPLGYPAIRQFLQREGYLLDDF